MSDQTAPARIWLQTGGNYAAAHEAALGSDAGVTWCDTQQDEDDEEYVRADEVERLRAENRRMELALFEIANGPMLGPAIIARAALSDEPDT